MDSDAVVRDRVEEELDWTPDVGSEHIGIAVKEGTVALSGEVETYAEKLAAKRAALRVRGVRAVIDDLTVESKAAWPMSEVDIAKEVEHALEMAANVPDTVKATIDGHHITLTGHVAWDFQRHAAMRAVQYLRGVSSVTDLTTLTARASAADAETRIRDALTRNAQLDASTIDATVSGNKVVLTGQVRSWAEKRQAGEAAWASPHVTEVDNRIVVQGY
ncbi:BON domain-containing protein [Microbacterium sp. X-17]|uniref:BON domain-containing protein n=1 Tax=Microbacterium sp. X-17 TaxID=3144404 RepID=UPI0031F54C00